MLELFLAVLLCVAIQRSRVAGCWPEAAGAAVGLYLLVLDTANFAVARFDELHPLHAFIFWLLGPGMWHQRGTSCLLGAALFVTPWAARTCRLMVSAAMAWRCTRAAARLGPLVREHETLGWVAAPFYVAATIDGLETLLYALGNALASAG